jgi:hypothetical protein
MGDKNYKIKRRGDEFKCPGNFMYQYGREMNAI